MSEQYQIVVVEDNPGDLYLIKRAIAQAGIDCALTSFTTGARAIDYINDPSSPIPRLMLLDINLPIADGAAVLRQVRSSPSWRAIAVLAFTSSHAPADVERINGLGVEAYIVKPSSLDGFMKIGGIVSEWLDRGAAHA